MHCYTMRYVLAVAELGSFSLASQACHVGQPALSQQVARLPRLFWFIVVATSNAERVSNMSIDAEKKICSACGREMELAVKSYPLGSPWRG